MAPSAAGRPPDREVPAGDAEQVVLRLPVVVVVRLSEKVQSVTASMSMYWPSQKRPPFGPLHFVVHPPDCWVTHV